MSVSEQSLWDTIDSIREREPRHPREAYLFVVASLGYAVQALPAERRNDPVRRHLSGSELLHAVVSLARREFGSLAPVVFREWGVRRNEDVGEIVFQLVRAGQLSARPEDTIDDFRSGPELIKSLEEDFTSQRR